MHAAELGVRTPERARAWKVCAWDVRAHRHVPGGARASGVCARLEALSWEARHAAFLGTPPGHACLTLLFRLIVPIF